MPVRLVRDDAELAARVAADRLEAGSADAADAWLALAERLADSVPERRRGRFEHTLAVVSLSRARSRGDFEALVERARGPSSPRRPGRSGSTSSPTKTCARSP
jgi:hypothetical protein